VTTIRGNIPSPNNANVVLTNVPCDSTVYVGAAVRMTLVGVAVNALADSAENANVLGIVEFKATSTLCNIRVLGVTEKIFTGLDVTKTLFLSPTVPGGLATVPPTSVGQVMVPLGQPFSATEMLVFKRDSVIRG